MINILLVCPQEPNGLSHHRLLEPHSELKRSYPANYMISRATSVDNENYKPFDIVYFQRVISTPEKTREVIDVLHKHDKKVFFDIDDTWQLTASHPQYQTYQENKVAESTTTAIKLADYVTTTTEYFADKLRPINKNVHVIPNALNPQTWVSTPTESPLTRIGWIGGVFHNEDIEMIRQGTKAIIHDKSLDGKYQLSVGGFNPNQFYMHAEEVFTDNYARLSTHYNSYLAQCTQAMEHFSFFQPYRRLWSKAVHEYQTLYNDIDVSLIPLKANSFSLCKSQIKAIESGFMKKAAIVSETIPYTYICNEKNSILVKESRKHKDWAKAMKRLIQNPNERKDLGEKLHEDVKDKYNLFNVNELRHQIYQNLK